MNAELCSHCGDVDGELWDNGILVACLECNAASAQALGDINRRKLETDKRQKLLDREGVRFVDIESKPGPGARRFWDERATALRKADDG